MGRPQRKVGGFGGNSLSPVRNLEFMLSPLYEKSVASHVVRNVCGIYCLHS